MIYRLSFLVGILALLGVAMAQTTIQPCTTPTKHTITVTGTAQRMVPPDLGIVVFAVQTQATTAASAVQDNDTTANRVMDTVRGLKVPNIALRTLNFSVQPIYETAPANRPVTQPLRIIGYQVANQVEARVPNSEQNALSVAVGKVIDAALGAGANRVDSLSFTLQNMQPAQQDVLAEATRNAHATAMTLATAAGVTLGQLSSLSTNPVYPQPPTPMFARATAMAESVPIEAGNLTVTATVSAVYEIQD